MRRVLLKKMVEWLVTPDKIPQQWRNAFKAAIDQRGLVLACHRASLNRGQPLH